MQKFLMINWQTYADDDTVQLQGVITPATKNILLLYWDIIVDCIHPEDGFCMTTVVSEKELCLLPSTLKKAIQEAEPITQMEVSILLKHSPMMSTGYNIADEIHSTIDVKLAMGTHSMEVLRNISDKLHIEQNKVIDMMVNAKRMTTQTIENVCRHLV